MSQWFAQVFPENFGLGYRVFSAAASFPGLRTTRKKKFYKIDKLGQQEGRLDVDVEDFVPLGPML